MRQRIDLSVVGPMLFVFLWSTGFIAARAGLEEAGPATFLFLRFSLVSVLMLCLLPVLRPTWPASPRALAHLVILGLMMQVIYFGGAWMAMSTGVGAGTAALILSLQPVLTALLAGPVLGESLQRRQWLGLGLGVTGVLLVVDHKLALGLGSVAGMIFCLGSLLGITAGTLYQKRFCPALDVFPGLLVQFVTATVIFLPLASLEGWNVTWSPQFVAALVWVAVLLSLVSVMLLTLMIRRHEATRITSLFFLVPPVTALIAWLVLGETMGAVALAGMALAVAGVALVVSGKQGAPA
ncbi:MAG: DMT family transporter [bacterium]|nr:DMT family transporter [bacterium]